MISIDLYPILKSIGISFYFYLVLWILLWIRPLSWLHIDLFLAACDQIGNTASYINTHIKNYDNTQRMVEIQKRLGGDKKLNIMEPGRVFMREGILHKVQ